MTIRGVIVLRTISRFHTHRFYAVAHVAGRLLEWTHDKFDFEDFDNWLVAMERMAVRAFWRAHDRLTTP